MSIKSKALLLYALCGVSAIVLISTIFNFTIVKYINKLEAKDVNDNFATINSILTREENNLTKTVLDWSHWDDTYYFIDGKNKRSYIQNNLQIATLNQLNLNLMLFTNVKGKKYYFLSDNLGKISVDSLVKKLLYKDKHCNGITSFIGNREVHYGLLPFSGKLLMIISAPITMTDEKSATNGSLIIGKYIDDPFLKYICGITKNTVKLEELTTSNQITTNMVVKKDPRTIKAYKRLKDVQGNTTILASIYMQREDLNASQFYLRILNIIFTILMIIVVVIAFFISDKYLLRRLKLLNEFIEEVGVTKNVKARINLPGKDEINKICNATNEMLSALDSAYSDMQKMDELFKTIMVATNDGYIDFNTRTNECYISPEWKNYIGYKTSSTDFDFFVEYVSRIHPDSLNKFKRKFDSLMKGETDYFEDEYKTIRASGDTIWVFHRGKVAERDKDGTIVRIVGTLLDITTRKNYEEEIINLGYTDKLTGLKNRAYVEQKLEKLDNNENNYSIIMGDINGLKLMNDTFGHREGDNFICAIANILKRSCSKDDIVARWGGDEFVILAIEKAEDYIDRVSENIKQECDKNTDFGLEVSIALGCANKKEMYDAEDVMNLAEERMYRGKLTEIRSSRNATIVSLEKTLYEKHSETEEHTQRIKKLSLMLGRKLGLSHDKLNELELLSLLHDIGKIGIPEQILMKPGKLTEEEWETMKHHTEIGYRIAKATTGLSHVAEEILSHHERYDGTGYPRGLKGEEIPVLSRIINIVDSYDVMTHSRSYKSAFDNDYALNELRTCAGTQFDPNLVDVFIELLSLNLK